jgi:hypothetical protein
MLLYTLKKVVKICDSVLTSRTNARKVENPPFQTAGPIRVNVALARAVIYDANGQ